MALKSKVKAATKLFMAKPSIDALKKVYSMLDKAVKNNVFHANKAARLKSNYSKKVARVAVVEKKTEKKVKKMS